MRNLQWILRQRPDDAFGPEHVELREATVPERIEDGEILLKTLFLHLAPATRNWMKARSETEDRNIRHPLTELGGVVLSPAVSQVMLSRNPAYPVGTVLFNFLGWQEYAVLSPERDKHPVAIIPDNVDIAQSLGVLGPNGLAAYFGLEKVGQPKPGEKVVISGAAGSTGSVAAQIAKLKGCHVIGIAGGAEKCRWLTEELGLDAAIDYKAESVRERLRALAPDGVDVFFDNVGGEMLGDVIDNMAMHGRVAICGQIATYDSGGRAPLVIDVMKLLYWRVRIAGFIMTDWWDEIPRARAELARWVAQGRIKHREDVRTGFDAVPTAFSDLFKGSNEGTLLVKLSDKAA